MTRSQAWPYLLALILYAFLLAAYVGLRFAWQGLDSDAALLSILSQNVVAEGTITPAADAYTLGYGYPTLNAFLSLLESRRPLPTDVRGARRRGGPLRSTFPRQH